MLNDSGELKNADILDYVRKVEVSGDSTIDLTNVDTVIISHGHYDHGGALEAFLSMNHTAKVYIQRRAFLQHESRTAPPYRNIGLNPALMAHPQVLSLIHI